MTTAWRVSFQHSLVFERFVVAWQFWHNDPRVCPGWQAKDIVSWLLQSFWEGDVSDSFGIGTTCNPIEDWILQRWRSRFNNQTYQDTEARAFQKCLKLVTMESLEKGDWNSISFHPSILPRSWREMGALLVVSRPRCWVAKAESSDCQLFFFIVECNAAFVAIWTKWMNSTQKITVFVILLFNEPPYSPFSWHRLGQGWCLACQRFRSFQGFHLFCVSYLVASMKSLRNLIPIQSPMDGMDGMGGMDGAVGHLFAGSLDWKIWAHLEGWF